MSGHKQAHLRSRHCQILSLLLHMVRAPPSSLPEVAVCARLSLHFDCYTENPARGVLAPAGGASLLLSCLAWDRTRNQGGCWAPLGPLTSCPHGAAVLELRGARGGCQLLLWGQRSLLPGSDFLKCKDCHSTAQSLVLKQNDVGRPLSTTSLPAGNLTWHWKNPIHAKLCDLGSLYNLSDSSFPHL